MHRTFHFKTRLNLVELLGRTARNVEELCTGIREVGGSSIYHHTHRFLQQHHYLYPEPPNDFAFWISHSLRLEDLGERLASIDTVKMLRINDLRDRYLEVLTSFLARNSLSTHCQPGEEFHFMSCRTFVLPTGYESKTLREFADHLLLISVDSLYFHMFEARLRLGQDVNDFSRWLSLMGYEPLAAEIARLDPYTMTLEGLRQKIHLLVKKYEQN